MKQIQIGGLTSFTTIDYPGKLAAVLFLTGCPIRCKYCSNPHLQVLRDGEYDPEKVIEWLADRRGKLEAVVFSGGEALMQGDATIDFMKRIRDMGFLIGLHTCGFYPSVFEKSLPFIDWVGLDFKTNKTNYQNLTGVDIAYEQMLKTLDIWITSGKPGEVRVTCDPRFIAKDSLLEIAGLLSDRGVKNFGIQKYIPHYENGQDPTTDASRLQFFNDDKLKEKINAVFETVCWRE
ncbi:MAG: anaerobic ribonucleoside-triphosphate reductase activating protein [Rickettsiales bacterium]|jgi:anaerobic ribonucleoside-triphosphate reductase activating protein|nr:anaerobic ribonucleoside-triphosphate reductase activating protein [Rickettsiales bacterium]